MLVMRSWKISRPMNCW